MSKKESKVKKAPVTIAKKKKRNIVSINAKDVEKMEYFSIQEDVLKVLKIKTQQNDNMFFRLLIVFYFGQVAANMRTKVMLTGRGFIPVNSYVINLASSGYGKGHSTYILNHQLLLGFRKAYIKNVMPMVVEERLRELAITRSLKSGLDEDDEYATLNQEFKDLGEMLFSFDSATTPAVKQFRSKLILGGTGAITFVADEIGSNLGEHSEVLRTFLELYDMGQVGDKLIKNTDSQIRTQQRLGATPANLLLFGTQSKLFDGGKNEDLIYSFITTGFARRCLFGFAKDEAKNIPDDPEVLYRALNDSGINKIGNKLFSYFQDLADEEYHGVKLSMDKEVTLLFLAYDIYCKKRAAKFPDSFEDHKAHYVHASFRVIKMAASYAFIDKSSGVKKRHLFAAIKLNEDSMKIFIKNIMVREKPYVRLAKYIGSINRELTHADLDKELPYYPSSKGARDDMLQMASAWGYSNHIVISTKVVGNIEFIKGKTLPKTNMKRLAIAYNDGKHTSDGYANELLSFSQIAQLVKYQDYNFINHHLKASHRSEKQIKKGFNFVVLDVDKHTHIETAKYVLAKYNYIMYTTKSHKKKHPRFRVILPISHKLELNKKEFTSFMELLYKWLPFEVDSATKDRSRKWLTNNGQVFYNDKGKMLSSMSFVPKSRKSKDVQKVINSLVNFSNLERWFAKKIKVGNRSHTLICYAMALVEQGLNKNGIRAKILQFNKNLGTDKLETSEINNTIMVTVATKLKEKK